MLNKVWQRLRGHAADEEERADEEVVRRELQASAPAPELEQLAAAHGAKLVHAHGAFIGSNKDSELPGTLIPGLEMIGMTLEFG
jgi:hypothetical protein